MTADYTIEATPGQVAAIERDGFLAVVGPTRVCPCVPMDSDGCDGCPGVHPVPTTKPCPAHGAGGYSRSDGLHRCCTDGTVPIVVEVVVPERACPDCDPASNGEDWCPICMRTVLRGHSEHHAHTFQATARDCWLPARTLLRGTAEAVPVVDDPDDLPGEPPVLSLTPMGRAIYWPEGESGPDGLIDVTDHFADVPRPEVGDTAWIIRGEGS